MSDVVNSAIVNSAIVDGAMVDGGLVAERGAVAPTKRRFTGRSAKRAVLTLVAVAALGAGAFYARAWWTDGRFIETTDDAYIGGDATAIAPHVPGFIAAVNVTDNQHVDAGQLLITLDDRDMRAALDRAQAVERQREAALDGLQARVQLQQTAISQAVAALDEKAAQATFARQDAARYGGLANTAAVTRQETERSLSLGDATRAGVASAQAALDGARQQLVVLRAQIAEATAAVAQASADVRSADLDLGYTRIRSPIDGYVGNRAARVGAYVAVGTYLLTIVPSRGLWVDANLKEDQLGRVRVGDAATVVADVVSDQSLHGHVLSLAPGTGAVFSVIPPENATGNFTKIVQRVPVRILLDGDDAVLGRLRPGLSATVRIDTRTGGAGDPPLAAP